MIVKRVWKLCSVLITVLIFAGEDGDGVVDFDEDDGDGEDEEGDDDDDEVWWNMFSDLVKDIPRFI